MNKELITQLKMLNSIEPDKAFARRSRNKILADKKRVFGILAFPRLILVGSLSFVLLIIAIILPAIIPGPRIPAALSADAINKEYDNLSINIQLKDINYDQTAQQTISSAINEVMNSKGKHLNSGVLEKESAGASANNTTNSKIDVDALLDQVIN